jgi:hypothetical protein
LTLELCLAAVQQEGAALERVPTIYKTQGICLAAVKQSEYYYKYVPEYLKAEVKESLEKSGPAVIFGEYYQLWLARVRQSGLELGSVPESLRTPEMCLAAVSEGGGGLSFVPEPLRTAELCLAAIQQAKGDRFADTDAVLEHVPEALKAQVKKAVGIE